MKIDPRNIYKLTGVVQHYAWGGNEFLPSLLGLENAGNLPFAEYWMGAHPSAPSLLNKGEQQLKLDEVFAAQPRLLGDHVQQTFHHLPYLFKVLDVREMLSIQVHPDKEEAIKGYEREEALGIDRNASNRNYKDRNHKPEVMVALGDFWLLHGFRPAEELKQTLSGIPQFRSLLPVFEEQGYRGLFRYVMELSPTEADAMLQPVVQKEVRRRSFHESEKTEPGYWVGEYYLNRPAKQIDRGVFVIYFLNIVFLERGQGIFQDAGVPHAYLQGQNIELMANSDNVLRGGLTNKHIDTAELIRLTKFEAITPRVLSGAPKGGVTSYDIPAKDFMLSRIELGAGQSASFRSTSPEIVLCIEGRVSLNAQNEVNAAKGEAVIVFPDNDYTVRGIDNSLLFRAAVP